MRPDDAQRALRRVDLLRLLPGIMWLLSVLACVALVGWRGAPDFAAQAAHDMSAGHQLSPDDLRSAPIDALVGHYLKADVKAGQPLTPDSASKAAMPRSWENAIAVVVQMRQGQSLGDMAVGSPAALYVGARQVGPLGRVASLDCDHLACLVTIAFPATASLALDPADLVQATVKLVKPGPIPQPAGRDDAATKG